MLLAHINVLLFFCWSDVNEVVVSVNDGAERSPHKCSNTPGRQVKGYADEHDDQQRQQDEGFFKQHHEDRIVSIVIHSLFEDEDFHEARHEGSPSNRIEKDLEDDDDEDVQASDEDQRLRIVSLHLSFAEGLGDDFAEGGFVGLLVLVGLVNQEHHGGDDDAPRGTKHCTESILKLSPHLERHVGSEPRSHQSDGLSHGLEEDTLPLEGSLGTRRLFGMSALGIFMAAIRYGIAGRPVQHSLSPLLTALVAHHLNLGWEDKQLKMELVETTSLTNALAWGYAGGMPSSIPWTYTNAEFGKFRTSALIKRAVEAAAEIEEAHPSLGSEEASPVTPSPPVPGFPTRMFEEELWLNLTAPLKHQLDSGAVMSIDASMETKSVNALRWDGRGWWCAGLDGAGVVDVLRHHGLAPTSHVLGLVGGGGGARSTAKAWTAMGGALNPLPSRRPLEEGPWSANVTEDSPDVVVDFDGSYEVVSDAPLVLNAKYEPMKGGVDERVSLISQPVLDGRWLLVAQHLACWRKLWMPNRAKDLPSLGLLMTRLLEAESVLEHYA